MYQYAADRNAVFPRYQLTRDWSYNAKSNMNGGLALVGNTLLLTTFSHLLVALDVQTGRELWHADLPNISMTTPIVAGHMVYVGTGRSGPLDRGLRSHLNVRNILLRIEYGKEDVWGIPGGDEIAAFDLRTGRRRWTFRTIGEDMPSAVYDRGLLIFANGEWRAYALRADTGRQLWSTALDGLSTMANAAIAGNDVVVGVSGNLVNNFSTIALDPANGRILWKTPYGSNDASPAYANGKVFISETLTPNAGSLQGKTIVAALDAKNGRPVWMYRGTQLGLWTGVVSSESAIAGTYAAGTYYQPIADTDQIVAFDGESGKIRWRFHTQAPVKMSPVVLGNRLYAGDAVGLLYTLDARTGRLLELRAFDGAFTTSPPIIAGSKLIVVNGTSVYMLPLSGFRSDHRYYYDEILANGK